MDQDQERPFASALSPQVVTMITTEHYNLQSAQGQEVADINGRTSLFIGAVSGALVALAFIGQFSSIGTPFYIFSLILLPSLIFMGLVTFERVIQSTYAVMVYARGINRLRHLYLEYAPQLRPYFILSAHDDSGSVTGSVGIRVSWWQIFRITPGMIAVVDGVLVGAFLGLLLAFASGASLPITAAAGTAAFLGSVAILQIYHWRRFRHIEQSIPTLFPSTATP